MPDRAQQIARTILAGFEKHFAYFQELTGGARDRFERADWAEVHRASAQRIDLYDLRVREAIDKVRAAFDIGPLDQALWQRVKLAYIGIMQDHMRPELAETFYNSVFCQLFHRKYYNNDNIFVDSTVDRRRLVERHRPYRSFYPRDAGLGSCVREILEAFYFGLPFEDMERDIGHLVEAFRCCSPLRGVPEADLRIDVLKSLFFRNKAAYIIGRVRGAAHHPQPFIIPLMNNERRGLYADALLASGEQAAMVFSFSRAYFMARTPVPAATVAFLQTIMPDKPLAELYMSIGFHKQAKNEFYRDLLQHLRISDDTFEVAPGVPGMVMLVFTLPSYPFVFKVIKDQFAPPKDTTRAAVRQSYRLVKMHDRIGRMADTLEFSEVALPLARFSPELLEELRSEAGSLLEFEGDEQLIIKHVYIERRMRPLNLLLEEAAEDEARAAIADWGLALKDLMAVNIFPGDLLFKNFGVTRHGRVVFYDYDEICYLTQCNFRKIPAPMFPEDELADEPHYSVDPGDVFPEEFPTFLTTDPQQRRLLAETHPELFDHRYWKRRQREIELGIQADVYPYPEQLRFAREDPEGPPR